MSVPIPGFTPTASGGQITPTAVAAPAAEPTPQEPSAAARGFFDDLLVEETPTTVASGDPKPAATPPPVEEPPVETPPAEVGLGDLAEAVLGTPTAPVNPKARDYSGIDEAHVPLFKNMNNEAFMFAKEQYMRIKNELPQLEQRAKQFDEISKEPVKSWMDHEQGFTLTPEFQQLDAATRTLQQQKAHWEQQLIKIEEGEDFHPLLQSPDGNIYVSPEPQQPSAAAKLEATRYIQACDKNLDTIRTQAIKLHDEFKKGYTDYNQRLSDLYTRVIGKHEAALKPRMEKFMAHVPPIKRSAPEAKVAVAALALMEMMVQKFNPKAAAATAATVKNNPRPGLQAAAAKPPTDIEAGVAKIEAIMNS